MQYFILKRKGFFVSEAPHNHIDWCGSTKRSHFNYEVTLVCPDKGQAIVIYHEQIADRIGTPSGTCESMAKDVCQTVERMLAEEGIEYSLLRVRIQPFLPEGGEPAAYMQYVSVKKASDMK